ncbi:hypothetical protein ACH5A2_17185 [Streptomyces collinus]|uniref:hypothetical protein n=1 Tax=Streptomyces collinus TaxID=42684 RepID=UPI0037B955BF
MELATTALGQDTTAGPYWIHGLEAWVDSEGKRFYLITDDRGGPVPRLADVMESIQLGMGNEPLAHSRNMLVDTPPGELRFLAERLTGTCPRQSELQSRLSAKKGSPAAKASTLPSFTENWMTLPPNFGALGSKRSSSLPSPTEVVVISGA